MSLYVPEGGSFELPANPVPNQPIDVVADEAMDWILRHIPFSANGIYRPELAADGGNCFAQAIGGVALLHEWGVASGVLLAGHHASIVVGKDDQVRFIDPNMRLVNTPEEEKDLRHGGNLGHLYQALLPEALENGSFVQYYYMEHYHEARWRSLQATAIRGATDYIEQIHYPHIIVDAEQGIDMLLACGDLARYAKNKPYKFEEEYYNLIGMVPDFKNPGNKDPYATLVHI